MAKNEELTLVEGVASGNDIIEALAETLVAREQMGPAMEELDFFIELDHPTAGTVRLRASRQ